MASLAVLWATACTTVVGLPDLPDVDRGGSAANAAATGTVSGGSGDDAGGMGAESNASSGSAGSAGSGASSSTGGSGSSGSSSGGASGGAGAGGSIGGSVSGSAGTDPDCSPECTDGKICESTTCVCPEDLTECSDGCVDLQSDQNNCGACGKGCDDGCSAGRCYREILGELDDLPRIAMDATHVYFTERDAGTVSRVARDGSGLTLLTAFQDNPLAIAVDATHVYWVNTSNGFQGRIMKIPLAGGDPVELASSELYPEDIAVNATHVYWTNHAYTGSVVRVPIGGGTKAVLASGTGLTNTYHLALDSTYVYWTNTGDGDSTGSIMRVPLAGGTLTTLAANVDSPSPIAVYGGQVYWGNTGFDFNGLHRMTATGGAVSRLVPGYLGWVSLAVDATGVYATGAGAGRNRLIRYSHDGSSQATLAMSNVQDSVAVDANEVVWGSTDGIRATAKTP